MDRTLHTWTSEDRDVLVADLDTARASGVKDSILDVVKAILQYEGGYRVSDLTSLTENLTAIFVPTVADGVYEYSLAATNVEDEVELTATLVGAVILYTYGAEVDKEVASGVAETVALEVGANTVTIKVHNPGYAPVTYTLTITRAAE